MRQSSICASPSLIAQDAALASSYRQALTPFGSDPAKLNDIRQQQRRWPARDSQIWPNPEQPAAFNRLALKADVQPHVPQIVWYVDGQPFAVTDRDETSAIVPINVR